MINQHDNQSKTHFFDNLKSFLNSNDAIYLIVLSTIPMLSILTSLEIAIGISFIMLLVTFFSMGIFLVISNKLDDYFMLITSIIVTFTEVIIISMILEAFLPSLHSGMGMYTLLIAVNITILMQIQDLNKNQKAKTLFKKAVKNITKIAGFMLSIGLFRELIGTGELKLGFILPMPFEWIIFNQLNLQSLAMPFILTPSGALFSVGFIIIGYKVILKIKRRAR
jgi:Na+-transporting NADH:ubiquinone oxidoreductase subunit D